MKLLLSLAVLGTLVAGTVTARCASRMLRVKVGRRQAHGSRLNAISSTRAWPAAR